MYENQKEKVDIILKTKRKNTYEAKHFEREKHHFTIAG